MVVFLFLTLTRDSNVIRVLFLYELISRINGVTNLLSLTQKISRKPIDKYNILRWKSSEDSQMMTPTNSLEATSNNYFTIHSQEPC